jgi:hypothetical protein
LLGLIQGLIIQKHKGSLLAWMISTLIAVWVVRVFVWVLNVNGIYFQGFLGLLLGIVQGLVLGLAQASTLKNIPLPSASSTE